MIKDVGHAIRNLLASWGAGVVLVLAFFAFTGLKHQVGLAEVSRWPVIAAVTICEGTVDPATKQCAGQVVTYKDFQQTSATCDGRDAIVAGTLSKVRSDAVYVEGAQVIYYGDPKGRFRRTAFEFMDDEGSGQKNRPVGVQDWGPWRLTGGCVTEYVTWFTTVEHTPFHGLWKLPTTAGPFPLPRAMVGG